MHATARRSPPASTPQLKQAPLSARQAPVSVRHQESCHCEIWRAQHRQFPGVVDLNYLLARLAKRGSATCTMSHLLQVIRRSKVDAVLADALARSGACSLIVSAFVGERILTACCDALWCLSEALALPVVVQSWGDYLGAHEALWHKTCELASRLQAPTAVVVPVLHLVTAAGEEGLLEAAATPPGKEPGWQVAALTPWITMHIQASEVSGADGAPLRRACAAALAALARMRPLASNFADENADRLLLRCLELWGASDGELLRHVCVALRRMARHGLVTDGEIASGEPFRPLVRLLAAPDTGQPALLALLDCLTALCDRASEAVQAAATAPGQPVQLAARLAANSPSAAVALAAAQLVSVAACVRGDRPDLFVGAGLPSRLAAMVAREPHARAADAAALLAAAIPDRPRTRAAWAGPVRLALAAESACLPRLAQLLASGDLAAQRAAAALLNRATAGDPATQQAAAGCGALQPLAAALQRAATPPTDAELARDAAAALCTLAEGVPAARAGLALGGAQAALLACLHAASSFFPEAAEGTALSAVRAVAALAGDDRQVRFDMGAAGAVPRLAFWLQRALGREAALAEACCSALLALGRENFLNQDRLLQLGSLHAVLLVAAANGQPAPDAPADARPPPSRQLVDLLARRRGAWAAEWERALEAVPDAAALFQL